MNIFRTFCLVLALIALATSFHLYGVAQPFDVVSVNPLTAAKTVISSVYTHELTGYDMSALDDAGQMYYVLALNGTSHEIDILGFDLTTGDLKFELPLPLVVDPFGTAFDRDYTNGDLIVVSANRSHHHVMLRVTPSTKAIVNLGAVDITDAIGAHCFAKGVMWIQCREGILSFRIIGVDTSNGKQLYDFRDNYLTMDFNWDTQSGMIMGVGFVPPDFRTRSLVQLNPANQQFTATHTLPAELFFSASISALNPTDRITYYYFAGDRGWDLVDINFDTGVVQNKVHACDRLADCSHDLDYGAT